MDLGAFSISLTVKDLERSRQFYEKLGFEVIGGEQEKNWLILKNGESTIGLFQEMFERNIITFNPGLTNHMERLEDFTDVREIQETLKKRGVEITQQVDEGNDEGPAHITLIDPDGNPILIDQFF